MAFRSHSYNQAPSTSLSITPPSGIVDGDVLVAFGVVDSPSEAISLPDGFTALVVTSGTNSPLSMTHDGGRIAAGIKLASGESGNYTMTSDGAGVAGGILCFSGRTSATPTASTGATTGGTSASSPWNIDATGLTAAAGDDLVFIAHSDHNNTSPNTVSFTPPSGFTSPGAFGAPGSGGAAFYDAQIAYKENVSAGATGTITGVGTLAGATAARGVFLIALPGTPTGGGGTNRRRRFLMAA